jgi:hypothetical protein
LLSMEGVGSTPRASPEHPPRIPRACPLQPSSSPLMGWFKVLSTPNHPLPKPELGWGFRLPPEVLPGCGPAGVLCTPTRTLQADPKQLKAAWAAGSLTRRALRRPPLSLPRHKGDPLASHRLVRVVGGLLPPPADPARFISGISPPKPLSKTLPYNNYPYRELGSGRLK